LGHRQGPTLERDSSQELRLPRPLGLATGGSWLCYFRALKLGDASLVAPIDKLSVVLVALFGVVFLGEHLTLPNWFGFALIAVGAILVAYKG
jgi:transporter family protein